jgi:hypothetical protein
MGLPRGELLKNVRSLTAIFIISFSVLWLPVHATDLPPGYWTVAESQRLIDRIRIVRLAPSLSELSPGERIAVTKLLAAGRIIEDLYERQLHRQAADAFKDLQSLDQRLGSPPETRNLLALYAVAQGPIIELPDNTRAPFLPVDPVQPGKNVYPWAITAKEVEAWLMTHRDERRSMLALRSVVRRAEPSIIRGDLAAVEHYPALATLHPGLADKLKHLAAAPDPWTLYSVPYSVAYADDIFRVYTLLNEAALAVQNEDEELARFLRNRGRDLLSDDYGSGDASWVTGRFKNLDVESGAYETYDDELFGSKAFFSLSLMIKRRQETAAVRAAMKNIQALESSLPYARHKRVRDDIPVGLYDVVADFGEARGGNSASILPDEPHPVQRYGRRIIIRSNILDNIELFDQLKQMWLAVVASPHRDELTMDGELNDTLWHELGHYLGVDHTRDGRTLGEALENAANVLEEMKADLVSLFVAEALQQQGYYDAAGLRHHYASGIARVVVKNKPRRDQAYETMQLMQWNYFMQQGLLSLDRDTGTLHIRYQEYHEVVGSLLAKILELQETGDKAEAELFIAQYSTWDEDRHGVVARKLRDAERYRYTLYNYAVLGQYQ